MYTNKSGRGYKFVPTNDDWSPTYDNGTVRGCVNKLSNNEMRISFWGNDDTGLELDLIYSEYLYESWNNWLSNLTYIDFKTLIELGFVGA